MRSPEWAFNEIQVARSDRLFARMIIAHRNRGQIGFKTVAWRHSCRSGFLAANDLLLAVADRNRLLHGGNWAI